MAAWEAERAAAAGKEGAAKVVATAAAMAAAMAAVTAAATVEAELAATVAGNMGVRKVAEVKEVGTAVMVEKTEVDLVGIEGAGMVVNLVVNKVKEEAEEVSLEEETEEVLGETEEQKVMRI